MSICHHRKCIFENAQRYAVLHKHVHTTLVFCLVKKNPKHLLCSALSIHKKKAKDSVLDPHDRLWHKYRNNHIKSSPVSLSWMSELKMEHGCSVVMGESCKSDRKVQSTSQLSPNHIFSDTRVHPQVITSIISSFPSLLCVLI